MSESSTFQNFTYSLRGDDTSVNFMRNYPDRAFLLPYEVNGKTKGLIAGYSSIVQGLPPGMVNRQASFYRYKRDSKNFEVISKLRNVSMSSELNHMSLPRHLLAAVFMPFELGMIGLDKLSGNKEYPVQISSESLVSNLPNISQQAQESNLRFQIKKSPLSEKLFPGMKLTAEASNLLHEGKQTTETKERIIAALWAWLES